MSELTEASEEALRRWPEIDTSAGGVISQSYAERYAMRRSGFAEGARWQAEQPVTDAQIEAAAITAVNTLHGVYPDSMPCWEDSSDDTQSRAKQYAAYMLEAARKAVKL